MRDFRQYIRVCDSFARIVESGCIDDSHFATSDAVNEANGLDMGGLGIEAIANGNTGFACEEVDKLQRMWSSVEFLLASFSRWLTYR